MIDKQKSGIFQIRLSSDDISVTAALLGYESVIAVDCEDFVNSDIEIRKKLKQVMRQLESKKYLRYDFDGTLYVPRQLKIIFSCLCEADRAAVFSTNMYSEKKTLFYILRKEDHTVLLRNIDKGKYLICLTDKPLSKKNISGIIPNGFFDVTLSENMCIKERILIEEAELAHKEAIFFNAERAETMLGKCIRRSEAVKPILKILSGECGYFGVKIYVKSGSLYSLKYNSLTVLAEGTAAALYLDENALLHFDGVDTADLAEQIILNLNAKGEP